MENCDDLSFEILDNETKINMAKSLLYQVYINEQNWIFNKNNPSDLKIIQLKDKTMLLTDRHDEYSIWFGAFYHQEIIACGRLCKRDKNGKFDINSYYQNSDIDSFLSEKYNSKLVELGKSAINIKYRGANIWIKLLLTVFQYCQDNGYSAFTTTEISKVKNLHTSIGFNEIEKYSFKYDPQDKNNVSFYFANYLLNEVSGIVIKLQNLLKARHSILND